MKFWHITHKKPAFTAHLQSVWWSTKVQTKKAKACVPVHLFLCILGSFACFFLFADFFQN